MTRDDTQPVFIPADPEPGLPPDSEVAAESAATRAARPGQRGVSRIGSGVLAGALALLVGAAGFTAGRATAPVNRAAGAADAHDLRADRGARDGGFQPGAQAPGGQAPGGQAPGGQVPGGQLPGGQLPGGPHGAGDGDDSGLDEVQDS